MPAEVEENLKPYWTRKSELSIHDGCLLWGNRIVVPPQGREMALKELHGGHPGVTRMKALARMFLWWPGIDKAIEYAVKHCSECQKNRPSPPVSPMQPWQWPTRPWHLDYAGPFMGRMFLVLIDAHSKWIEVYPVSSATSTVTIQHLRGTFAQFGIPECVVTDNGSCFTSAEFESFMKKNGIYHIKSSPYHQATNGLAERAVQVFKHGMKKMKEGTVHDKIARLLFNYRITPHTTTGISPAMLLMNRTLRTRLDAIRPSVASHVEQKQFQQKAHHDVHSQKRSFEEGEEVYVRSFGRGDKWSAGSITAERGPVSNTVQLEDGTVCRRHQDHIRKRWDCVEPQAEAQSEIPQQSQHEIEVQPSLPEGNAEESATEVVPQTETESAAGTTSPPEHMSATQEPQPQLHRSYPTRTRKPPIRYSGTLTSF